MNGDTRAKYGECLTEEILSEYLEGTLSPVARNASEAHLVACDPCRRNLALFMRVLRDDLTPNEEIALQRLEAVCERQGFRAGNAPAQARFRHVRRLAYLLASLIVLGLLVFGTGLLSWITTPPASEITAALLSGKRPFEPRIAGQPYRPLEEVTRGPEGGTSVRALADALADRAAQAYEMGQFFLIQKEYADAIRYLRTAAADASAAAEVHNDLGVAYLQNGEATFGLAETEFKTALRKKPNHAPALFNLSILYEREGLSGQAEETWRQYLQVDPESGWAQEIKRKLGGEGAVRP